MVFKYVKNTYIALVLLVWTVLCILASFSQFIEEFNSRKFQQPSKVSTARNIFFHWNKQRPNNDFSAETEYSKESYVQSSSLYTVEELQSLKFSPSNDLNVNCNNVLEGVEDEIVKAKLAGLQIGSQAFAKNRDKYIWTDDMYGNATKDCKKFREERKYIQKSLSPGEENFPIAYVITIHKKLSMFERLLRSIYQPQNVYCVHVDEKTDEKFYNRVRAITQCFPNVFVSSKRTNVHYTHWSRVEADLNCLNDLLAKKSEYNWKYVINLCGQDFPLKTNLEITQALRMLYGRNNLETVSTPNHKKSRYTFRFELPENDGIYSIMKRTTTRKTEPPISTPMFAGSAYYLLTYEAVKYAMTDSNIQVFFKWNEDTFSPDEHLWATLHRMFPHFPGSIPPDPKYDINEIQSITRLVKWYGVSTEVYPKCEGRYMRGVCVYGAGDLTWLVDQHHIFANKFDDEQDFIAVECLDQWLRNRTMNQAISYLTRGYT